jgi:hypothetical protein
MILIMFILWRQKKKKKEARILQKNSAQNWRSSAVDPKGWLVKEEYSSYRCYLHNISSSKVS